MGPAPVDDNPRRGAMEYRIVPHAMMLEAMDGKKDGKCNLRLPPRFSFDPDISMGEPVEEEGARPELACKPAVPGQRGEAKKTKKADMMVGR